MVEQPDRTQTVSRVGLSRGVAFALVTLFVVAVLFNYPWELVQAPLYVGMDSFSATGWHCFKASLGDGLLVLLIFAAGWAVRQRSDWFVHPGVRGYVVMLATGLIIGISVEWVAVHVMGRWVYTAQMPLVPGLGIGIVPLLQMLVLPPLIFRVATVWRRYLSSGGL
jgi:hypothetical protein